MISFPDVQKRAQAELDKVVGRDKMPTFSDYEHLHYIRAIIEEIMRWRPVVPLGVSHRVSQDDEYEGYHIPKDALVIPNVWYVLHRLGRDYLAQNTSGRSTMMLRYTGQMWMSSTPHDILMRTVRSSRLVEI